MILVISEQGKFKINTSLKISFIKNFQNNILFIEEYQLQLLTMNCVSSIILSLRVSAFFIVNSTGNPTVGGEEENERE